MTDDQAKGIIGAVESVSNKVLAGLPAQFLALVLINVVFMGAFVWYVDARSRHSVDIIQQLLSSCLQQSR